MSIQEILKSATSSGHFVETDFQTTFDRNPQHAVFWFARYKFVARMFAGFPRVIEIGCGNGFAGAIVRQSVGKLEQTDKDRWNPSLRAYGGGYDGAFALDVIEHIPQPWEDSFIANIGKSLEPHGSLIIGTPSLESQPYASPLSKQEHINVFTQERLHDLMKKHFHCVYMFGMNDEVVHTGFAQMCHYRFALANTPR
jgi:hypothetical protein